MLTYCIQTLRYCIQTLQTPCIDIYILSIAVWPAISGLVSSSAVNREYTGWLKDRVLKPAWKLSLVVTFMPSESAQPDQITDLSYILNCCTARRFEICPFISKQRVYWLAERQSLKACTKITTCGNFRTQRECSTWPKCRSNQGAIYSQLLYSLPFRGMSLHQQRTESIYIFKCLCDKKKELEATLSKDQRNVVCCNKDSDFLWCILIENSLNLDISGIHRILQWGGFKSNIKNLVTIYTLRRNNLVQCHKMESKPHSV